MKSAYLVILFMSLILISSCGSNSTKENTADNGDQNASLRSSKAQENNKEGKDAEEIKKFLGRWKRTDGNKELMEITFNEKTGIEVKIGKKLLFGTYDNKEDVLRLNGPITINYNSESDELKASGYVYNRIK